MSVLTALPQQGRVPILDHGLPGAGPAFSSSLGEGCMSKERFDYSSVLRPDLPAADARWTGFPQFNFVGGHNDEKSVPVEGLRAAADAVLAREGPTLGTYFLQSGPQGYLPLREFLCRKLETYAGMHCSPDDVLLTSGSLQAIDLVNEVLLEPGDTVVIEESNYGGVLSRLARLDVDAAVVPLDEDGMRTDVLEKTLAELSQKGIRPKYIYTIPTVHNPTGTILTETRRRQLLDLALRYDLPVFEDECYADLIWDGERPPALRALDDTGRVIHVGSFSKCIAPALRVGYVVADWPVLAQMLACKKDAGSGALEQMVLAEYCATHFDEHVVELNKTLKRKLDALMTVLDEAFGTSVEFAQPKGGIFLWVKFTEAVDTARLAEIAGAAGIAVNPGRDWSRGGDASQCIRICYANPEVDTIREGILRLAAVCREEFGFPVTIGNVRQ